MGGAAWEGGAGERWHECWVAFGHGLCHFVYEANGASFTRFLVHEVSLQKVSPNLLWNVAVCQCSGNRRGLFDPPVPGLQWEHGAMGCAEWRGVRLAEVLAPVSTDHAGGWRVPRSPRRTVDQRYVVAAAGLLAEDLPEAAAGLLRGALVEVP